MFSRDGWLLLALVSSLAWGSPTTDTSVKVGRVPTAAEVALWNIDVSPHGTGLPPGSGTVAQGRDLYANDCLACHGVEGQGGIKDRLVGGIGSLATATPIKTVGSYWSYATTLYDYMRRAMHYQAPGSLSNDDYYALAAYLLSLNGIVPADGSLDQHTLPDIKMPNRDGFIPEPEYRQVSNSRQKPGATH
jgi:cytochrome c